jgi:hypothetical protein
MDKKRNSFRDDEERIILSQNISKDDSKMAILKKEDESRTVFNRLNKADSLEEMPKKSLSKSFKEDEDDGNSQKGGVNDDQRDKDQEQSDDEIQNTGAEGGRRLTKKEKIVNYKEFKFSAILILKTKAVTLKKT